MAVRLFIDGYNNALPTFHLDHLTADQLLRLAVILHDCYRSYDVALYLLTEYDRRRGTKHGQEYMKAFAGAA